MNMKKTFVMLMGMVLISVVCLAQNPTAITEYSYEIRNNSSNAKSFIVPITSIRPKIDKLVKYVVMPYPGATYSETYCGIFDDIAYAMSGEILGEKEAINGASAYERFPRPLKIANGIVTQQGPYTTLILTFVRE